MFRFYISIFCACICASRSLGQTYIDGFINHRYEVKKKSDPKRSIASENEDTNEIQLKLKKSKTTGATKVLNEVQQPLVSAQEVPLKPDKPLIIEKANKENAPQPAEPTINEQLSSIVSSQSDNIQTFYKEQIHPEDNRLNRLEFDLSTGLTYNESKSNYAYRSYNSSYNHLKLRPAIWLTPLVGISLSHEFSLAADIDSTVGSSRSIAKYEITQVGINFRKFMGLSRQDVSLEYGLQFLDSKLTVPSDDTSRNKLKSSGIGLGLKTKIPLTSHFLWSAGFVLFPRMQHQEDSTSIAIHSGNNSNNVKFDLELGGEYKLDRENQIIFSLVSTSEKNYFEGTAALTDPKTGTSPTNVSITNMFSQFIIGYRWSR